jgi:hypothetical protein
MSLYDYKVSRQVTTKQYPFYSLVMAAMRRADDINMEKLKRAWPDVHEELTKRYNAPGGELPEDFIHKIEGRVLQKSDVGSKVTYVPNHANGNAQHEDCEGGTIASWNSHYVFVNYGTGTNKATSARDLVWG